MVARPKLMKLRMPAMTADRGFINYQAAMLHSMAATETNNYEVENEWGKKNYLPMP